MLRSDGPAIFRSSTVKPYYKQNSDANQPSTTDSPAQTGNNDPANPAASIAVALTTNPQKQHSDFSHARRKELNGLMQRRCLSIVPLKYAKGHRIYGTRFDDRVKFKGQPQEYLKSRLILQGYDDKGHGLLTNAPTVPRSSQRLLLAIAAILCSPPYEISIYTRDITQVYTQSEIPVRRQIYARPPKELNLPSKKLLKVVYPLYGLTEAGALWFHTYHTHHTHRLNLSSAPHDLCLLYTKDTVICARKKNPSSVTCLQTDDTLFLANKAYLEREKEQAKHYQSNPLTEIQPNQATTFNGVKIIRDGLIFRENVAHQVEKLDLVKFNDNVKSEYISQRALGAYIASHCQPDLSFGFASASQHIDPQGPHVDELNNLIEKCIATKDKTLSFIPLDECTTFLGVFIDASFANNVDNTSQLGYLICLIDASGNANIIHYASQKCKRITRSVLAAELYAMVLGFDNAFVIHHVLCQILSRKVALKIYTDSRCLFDSLTTLNQTTEKRLLIDLSMLREGHENRAITENCGSRGPKTQQTV